MYTNPRILGWNNVPVRWILRGSKASWINKTSLGLLLGKHDTILIKIYKAMGNNEGISEGISEWFVHIYIYSEKILIIWQRLRAASTTLVILKPRFTDGGTICPGTIWSYGRGSLAWLEQNELSPVSRVLGTITTVLQLNIAVEIFFPRSNCTLIDLPKERETQSGAISREFTASRHTFSFFPTRQNKVELTFFTTPLIILREIEWSEKDV